MRGLIVRQGRNVKSARRLVKQSLYKGMLQPRRSSINRKDHARTITYQRTAHTRVTKQLTKHVLHNQASTLLVWSLHGHQAQSPPLEYPSQAYPRELCPDEDRNFSTIRRTEKSMVFISAGTVGDVVGMSHRLTALTVSKDGQLDHDDLRRQPRYQK